MYVRAHVQELTTTHARDYFTDREVSQRMVDVGEYIAKSANVRTSTAVKGNRAVKCSPSLFSIKQLQLKK
jgi:hypothetical protein